MRSCSSSVTMNSQSLDSSGPIATVQIELMASTSVTARTFCMNFGRFLKSRQNANST